MRSLSTVALTVIFGGVSLVTLVLAHSHAARARPQSAAQNRREPDNAKRATSVAVPARATAAVAASDLLMGSPEGKGAADEHPQHRVRVSAFTMDSFEVTNERYGRCVTSGHCVAPTLQSSATRKQYFNNPAFAQYPVVFVDWQAADTFCRWDGGRLPTEA